jgi:hypothetical protein
MLKSGFIFGMNILTSLSNLEITMKKIRSILSTLIFGCCFSGQVFAGDCSTLLEDLMDWAKTSEAYYNHNVNFILTANTGSSKYASYTTGSLDFHDWFFGFNRFFPENLSGEGKSYFSDRTWSIEDPNCTGFCGPLKSGPFNPDATDKLGVTLTKNSTDPSKANVSLTLKSWGNGKINFSASCDNGHIYGFSGSDLFDLSFKKAGIAVIR